MRPVFLIMIGMAFAAAAGAASLEEPTHVEGVPIKFDIGGDDGRLKTIAMDSNGNLLVGVSFIPPAGKTTPQTQKPKPALTERLRAATRASDGKAWDRAISEASIDEIIETMRMADPETRQNLMNALPESKRGQIRQNMRNRSDVRANTDARGGLNPALSPPEEGHVFALKVVSPQGQVLATWPMLNGLQPKMIHGCEDGLVFVAGGGKLAAFDATGKLLKMIDTDAVCGIRAVASGLYVSPTHVILALGFGNSTRATEDVWRFKRDLTEPKKIIERLYGCCSHIDLEVQGKEILIGENSRHRVNRYDIDGNFIATWGKRDRASLEGFTACCNPCNSDIGPGGVYYAAESGVGRIKKYSTDGKFLGLVGYVDTTKFDGGSALAAQSCYIPVEVNQDASRIYVMDVRAHFIRVLEKKS